ncbi:MAG: type IV toxin-antitoxin system AbiEi family antitoxin domain-containing protein [Solirubrobacterales bacterium]|nr:type IV toxin-antitoxin system AbiEi family antitoxin domain-containing protein [Solirubrobacterales bacterium]
MDSGSKWNELTAAARYAGGTVTAGEVERAGFSRNDIYAARDHGYFVELSRGVFRLTDAPPVSHLDFVAVCKRVPSGTICLESSLSRWDLVDDIPSWVHIAVPRGAHRPKIERPPTKVHVFSAETASLERIEESLPTGERYWIYSAERSVIDALRVRKRHGGGPGLEPLRRYLHEPRANRRKLIELSRELNVERSLLDALEILG